MRAIITPLALALTLAAGNAFADTIRISNSMGGGPGNDSSADPMLSADGRFVVYESEASDLVSGDTNNVQDIFLYDVESGQTTRVSVSSAGAEGDGVSFNPKISADGRYVVFQSLASNLVAGDTNAGRDIFRYDRVTGETLRVSVADNEAQSNDESHTPDITPDGNEVVFSSFASNLVAGDTNSGRDIFIRNIGMGTTTRVNLGVGGAEANAWSYVPQFSRSGRFVFFESDASNLVNGDSNGLRDAFVLDRETGVITRENVATSGAESNGDIWVPDAASLSADGRWVIFCSRATNLVGNDTNGTGYDVFLRDRVAGTTSRLSSTAAGAGGNGDSCSPTMTPTGRFVAMEVYADDLLTPDGNGTGDILTKIRDRIAFARQSVSTGGAQADDVSRAPSISANGKVVAFRSFATNLASNDTANDSQVYLVTDTGYDYDGANDLNANGLPDFLVRHNSNGWWRRFTIENGAVADVDTVGLFNNLEFSHQANADFDNDGDADVLIRRSDGQWRLFEMEGGSDVGVSIPGLFTNTLWAFVAAYDFDDDGDADILMRRADNGQWRLFEMQGGDVRSSTGVALFQNALWTFQGVGDFDGDGDGDVLLRQSNNNLWRIFRIENRNVVGNAGPGPLFNGANWQFIAAADFDRDYVSDILLRNSSSGQWRIFRMVNRLVSTVTNPGMFTNQSWQFMQAGDSDGDADADITLRNSTSGAWRTFEIQNRSSVGSQALNVWLSGSLQLQN